MRGHTPCHATLTETLRILDAQAVADILGAVVLADNSDDRHIAIDGKTLRASKDGDGRAEHVLSAFCGGLQTILSHEASRGKGLEIPDALKAVWIAAIAAPPMLCFSWAWEGSPIALLSAVRWPVMAAGVEAYAAICSTLAATGSWAWLLTRHSVALVAPLSLLVPVFGMSLSAVLLGERFDAQDLYAAAIVLLGLMISLGLVSGRKAPTRPRFVRNS